MKKVFLVMFFYCINIYVFSQTKEDSLIVFVGEKISVQSYSPLKIDNDSVKIVYLNYAIKARYRIFQKLNGNYENNIIDFISFDHNGDFYFTKPKYVLLFVRKGKDGNFYHLKHQYHPVAKTTDGKWACRGNDIRLNKDIINKVTFESMTFENSFSYLINNKKRLRKRFPKSLYKKENNRMVPIMGVRVDQIFDASKYLLNREWGYNFKL
ncbi:MULTISPECIES: hypothetical protein [unclassified Chryseobacterium]|uniref:hypothetical protein n=1 Tax=unclassified Chryseobacterium TaxID=2593645 RepID=UPI0030105EC4